MSASRRGWDPRSYCPDPFLSGNPHITKAFSPVRPPGACLHVLGVGSIDRSRMSPACPGLASALLNLDASSPRGEPEQGSARAAAGLPPLGSRRA